MAFKPGDKVRFLNESGGGYVTRIINSFMVSVAIEDGFEIPTLTSNLVLVGQKGSHESLFDSGAKQPLSLDDNSKNQTTREISEDAETRNTLINQGIKESQGIYLAFVPKNQNELTEDELQVYLINHTPYQILFNLFLKEEKGYAGIDYGSISKNSNLLVKTIEREELEMWTKGVAQVLLHADKMDEVYFPVSEYFALKPSKFYHEAGYSELGLLSGRKSITVVICLLESVFTTDQVEQATNMKQPVQVKASHSKAKNEIDLYRVAPREAEVDLHISALSDNYDKLNPHEILMKQMRYFEQMLENALSGNYYKVTFIHGIGNGTLKAKMIEYLRNYEDIEIKNAPFAKYGNGALELHLLQNS